MSQSAPPPLERNAAQGHRYALCVSRYNSSITERLLEGATQALVSHGADPADLHVHRCAGVFELTPLAASVADRGDVDGLVAIGCLIQGATDHYQLLADEVTRGLGQVALQHAGSVAVAFGVLTCHNDAQAEERAVSGTGNKGAEVALACIEQVNTFRKLKG